MDGVERVVHQVRLAGASAAHVGARLDEVVAAAREGYLTAVRNAHAAAGVARLRVVPDGEDGGTRVRSAGAR